MSQSLLSRIKSAIGVLAMLPGCGDPAPDPTSLRDRLSNAKSVRFRCELDRAPADWTVSDPAALAKLSRMMEFQGQPSRAGGVLGTTDVIYATTVREGREEPLFTLVAGVRVFYEPKKRYYVELANKDLRDSLISQARQHLVDPPSATPR